MAYTIRFVPVELSVGRIVGRIIIRVAYTIVDGCLLFLRSSNECCIF